MCILMYFGIAHTLVIKIFITNRVIFYKCFKTLISYGDALTNMCITTK